MIETTSGKIGVAVTRVVIGANSAVARACLVSVLSRHPAFKVIGSFSVENLFAQFEDLQPDVVILDSRLSSR